MEKGAIFFECFRIGKVCMALFLSSCGVELLVECK